MIANPANKTISTFLLKGTLLLIGLVLVSAGIVLWAFPYPDFCRIVLQSAGKLHRLQEFQQQFLTPGRFSVIRWGMAGLAVLYLAVVLLAYQKICSGMKSMAAFLILLLQKVKARYSFLSRQEKAICWLALGGLLVLRIYQAATYPVSYDEAWTYLNMSSKNVLVSASYYPAPNNHILFSLLTNLSTLLPVDVTFALRLPNVILLGLVFWSVLLILKELFDFKVAILSTVTFASSYPVALYSVQARGYLLYAWFALLGFYIMYKIVSGPARRFHWGLWIAVSTAGFYSIPSYLYAFVASGIYGFIFFLLDRDYAKLRALIWSGLVTVVLTLLLYTPVFLVSGWQSVFNNPYVSTRTRSEVLAGLPTHLLRTGNWFLGSVFSYGYLFVAGVVLYLLLVCFTSKIYHRLTAGALIFLITPPVFLLAHSVIPFERTWVYCFWPLTIGIALMVLWVLASVKAGLVSITLLICAIITVNSALFARAYSENYALDRDAEKIAKFAMAGNLNTFRCDNDYLEVLLFYHYTLRGRSYSATTSSQDVAVGEQKRDCLILPKDSGDMAPDAAYQNVNISRFARVFVLKK